jgi:thiamine biosynthesis lipoprotein
MKRITFLIIFFLLYSCGKQEKVHEIKGFGIGTYYKILYTGKEDTCMLQSVDSVIRQISSQFSIFDTNSLVTQLNRGKNMPLTPDFITVFEISQKISTITDGAFDITIGPLVNLWGFGLDRKKKASQELVDSIKTGVGYRKVRIENNFLCRENDAVSINFNAVAKGFCVDKLAEMMKRKGYHNFMIEVGGEIRMSGSKKGKPWMIGIQVPTATADGAFETDYIFFADNKSIATSGNYRNYTEENGVRYAHIINPKSGYPEQTTLLSVTVLSDECAITDAFATAFMVLGIDESMKIIEKERYLEALFIYDENGTFKIKKTKGFPNSQKER